MKCVLALLLLAATLGGCSLLGHSDGPDGGEANGPVLTSGTSFGECLGYCITELTVAGRSATLVYSGWETNRTLPDIRHQRTLTDAERARLDAAFDRTALQSADDVYGCPDCADGGAEWVGATWDDGEKRITFEYGTEVGGLDEYIIVMRALRAAFPPPPTP